MSTFVEGWSSIIVSVHFPRRRPVVNADRLRQVTFFPERWIVVSRDLSCLSVTSNLRNS